MRRESGERDRFLDEACEGDIDFRIEVESLLISLAEAKTFLERPVIGEVPQPKSAWQLEVGQAISHYRIVSPIASGGMGMVYLAEDEQLRRQVALKVLPEDLLENRERLQRFQREAQVVSALNHPNILTIFEFGTVDDIHFLASEFVKGETLRARIENGRLTLHDALEIATQIASALKAAHEAGVVHRDIKPENVMIRDDGYVKVLDFGLAKLAAQPTADFETVTKNILSKPGVIMGTVTYMSPEQARARPMDARSDLFSFGVVLFEMLTGRVPFAGETMTDVIAGIIQETPRPASRYNNSVPDDMDRIIAKCLEKDREERYQTAADLLADLKRISKRNDASAEPHPSSTSPAGRPTEILFERPTEKSVSLPRPSRKHAFAAAGAIAAIVVALLVLGYSYYSGQNTKQIESIAVMPFVNESGDANFDYLSDGLSESVIDRLSQLPQLKVISRNSSFKYREQNMNFREVAKALGVQAIVTGRVARRGDNLSIRVEMIDVRDDRQLWSESYNRKAVDALRLQEEIAQTVTEKLSLKLSGAQERRLAKHETVNPQAYELLLKGRFRWRTGALESQKEAVAYYQQAISLDPNYALAYAELSAGYSNLVNNSVLDPKEFTPKAEVAVLKALALDDTLADAHLALATFKLNAWDWTVAEAEYKRAIELNPNLAEAHRWYSVYLTIQSRHEQAIAEIKRARELDPLSLLVSADVGWTLHSAGQYDEAIAAVKKTLELDQNLERAHNYLGYIYAAKGMYAEAIAAYQDTIRLGGQSPSVQIYLGAAYARSGEREKAHAILRLLQTSKEYVSPGELAILYGSLGEREEAFASLEKAYAAHDLQLQYLGADPAFDPLRSDTRFQDLLRRVGLPQ